jgi:hypothetical protein
VPVAQATTIPVTPGAVDTTANGNCSLVEAINSANTDAAVDGCRAGSGADTIKADATFVLMTADNDANGLPVIISTITVKNATIKRDAGAPAFRIFEVAPGANLTLVGATVSGGRATDCPGYSEAICGGGIVNLGTLHVSSGRIVDNTAAGSPSAAPDFTFVEGGGIDNLSGTVTVFDSEVTGNSASNMADGGTADGGGISNNVTLTVQNSRVTSNSVSTSGDAPDGGVGGGISNYGAQLTVTGSQVANNTVACSTGVGCFLQGGGIYNTGFFGSTNVSVTDSQVNNNTVSCAASSCAGAGGGGIFNESDTTLALDRSQVADNAVSCTASSCTSARGGGIYSRGTTLAMTNSQTARNSASCSAGSCTAQGGGMFVRNSSGGIPSTVTLTTSAVIDNRALGTTAEGGGIFKLSGTVTLDRSRVARNTPNNCWPLDSMSGCNG